MESEREQEKLVDEFVTKGYKIENRGQRSAKVKEKDWGSPPVHVFVFIFSLIAAAVVFDAAGAPSGGAWVVAILANVTYAAYSWFTAEEVIIRVDESTGEADAAGDADTVDEAGTTDASDEAGTVDATDEADAADASDEAAAAE